MSKYDEKSIQLLKGLEAVRKRPGMYIGSTDQRGLHHLVWEIFDNSVDEALAGFGKTISITIKQDNSIEISDEGRGVPFGKHSSGIDTMQLIFTTLHSGGKFTASDYKVSGGLHGVGSSVVNALSTFFIVTVCRDGQEVRQKFSAGGSKIGKLEKIGASKKTGTSIHFKPDAEIFSTTIFNYETIHNRVRESAFLIKGLKVVLKDERTNKTDTFLYKNGLNEYVELLGQGKKSFSDTINFHGKHTIPSRKIPIDVEISFQYFSVYSETILSFVNNVKTPDGGTHEIGFKTGFTKAINEYARKYQIIKPKDSNLEGVDIREGIICIISLKISEDLLEFEGQTKSKLGTPDARNATDQIVYENLIIYLEENKSVADNIIKKALASQKARDAAKKAREAVRNDKSRTKKEFILSGKLSPAQSKNRDDLELFLVEGDSAGGSAKQGRNRLFQAILPLRGKVINTERATSEQILKNEEIATVINAIGADFGSDFKVSKMNYSKIIIMTDADTDGAHIQTLLLTFFFRFMIDLVKQGKLYIAQPPLYRLSRQKGKGEENIYIWDDQELDKMENTSQYKIQRFKGLGEMNSDQLWDTTMNPNTRSLIQVQVPDQNQADKKISILMGDDVQPRREWIENNVDFEVVDDFLEKTKGEL